MIWGLNGWFQSFGAPGGVVAMTAWFSNNERGRAYGVWSTAHSIGEGLTFLVVGGLVAWLGWQWGYWGPGLIGIVTAIGVFALLQDRPQTLGLPPVNEWKNDQYSETAEDSAAKHARPAILDPQDPGDLGARAGQRDDLRHPLRRSTAGASSICRKPAAIRCRWPARC